MNKRKKMRQKELFSVSCTLLSLKDSYIYSRGTIRFAKSSIKSVPASLDLSVCERNLKTAIK
jgi:hypothetical protein